MPLNERGWEVPDPTPVTRKVSFDRKPSTLDEIRHALGIIRKEAEAQGFETPEEADDFNIEGEDDPTDLGTRWEIAGDERFDEVLAQHRLDVEQSKRHSRVGPRTPRPGVPADPPRDRPDDRATPQPPVERPAQGEA